ncbi:ATP-binding protein [Bifidobacterium thermophilum]|uniref:ATP-binding protein n=1 Tax=Bifidobacterium thermophilum TaxID=33905 RepID=UPI003F92856C
MTNPFKPTAGMTPPVLVGRQHDLDDFSYALDDGVGAPGRLMYITGARGVGKTVMLNALGNVARQRDWLVIDETAENGFMQRLIDALRKPKHLINAVKLPSASMGVPGTPFDATVALGSVELAGQEHALDFRQAMGDRLDKLEKKQRGILITLDEVQASSLDEMRSLATAVQHLIREQRNIAFVFAGLPSMVEDVVNDKVLTFLRRAERRHLGDVPLEEVRNAFKETITANGLTTDEATLDMLAAATNGYPFMIQLVGYWTWRAADGREDGPSGVLTSGDAENGIARAKLKLGDMVHGPALDSLSPVARDYLLAMAQDDGPSSTRDVARRLERDAGYANVYRTQLIKEDIIYATGYGYVDFKLPYLRDYLREHGAYHQMRRTLEAGD